MKMYSKISSVKYQFYQYAVLLRRRCVNYSEYDMVPGHILSVYIAFDSTDTYMAYHEYYGDVFIRFLYGEYTICSECVRCCILGEHIHHSRNIYAAMVTKYHNLILDEW